MSNKVKNSIEREAHAMEVSIQKDEIVDALSKIVSIVEKKSTHTYLTYCLLTARDETLEIDGTNLELSMKVICPAKVLHRGKTCVNPRHLFDLIRNVSHHSVHLKLDRSSESSGTLKIISGNLDVSLLTVSSQDFPVMSFNSKAPPLTLSGPTLLRIISKTSYAIGTDETRRFLNGVFLHFVDGKIRAVATNGYMFALINLEAVKGTSECEYLSDGIIIPKKGLSVLKKVIESAPDLELSIKIDNSFMYFSFGDRYQSSIRLISQKYPDYEKVIPKTTVVTLTVIREELINAIKRVKVLADEKSRAIKLVLKSDKLVVSASEASSGEAKEEIDIVCNSQEELAMGFNAQYLLDSLSVFNDEKMVFRFNNELSPFILESTDNNDFLSIVMPLKLR